MTVSAAAEFWPVLPHLAGVCWVWHALELALNAQG